ncbi:MAG: hypothetical protein AUH85_12020 [Chloroflexi bacterium 13_1_40CM_4_68_4]|nr:MAG: hypothetical protein AUH85_12020 [Chloroflexi bacterium 13_1_40CM_4_68_4]
MTLKPPAYPPIVTTEEDRARFDRLYHDLVSVIGLPAADALLQATAQFQLGFDATLMRRKRRKKVHLSTPEGEHMESPDEQPG